MKKLNHNITYIVRLLAVVSIVCAMMIQPTMQSFAYLNNQGFELVELDSEENSNEKENQEEDSKEKKVEFQVLDICDQYLHYVALQNSHKIQVRFTNIIKDIPSPPPDLA